MAPACPGLPHPRNSSVTARDRRVWWGEASLTPPCAAVLSPGACTGPRAWPQREQGSGDGLPALPFPTGREISLQEPGFARLFPPSTGSGGCRAPSLLPSIDFIAWIFSWPSHPCPAPAPQHRGGLGACAGSPLPLPPAWPCHLPVIYCSFGRGGQRGSPRGRTSRAGGQGVAGVGRSRRQPPFVGGRHNDPAQAVCSPRRVITVPGGEGRDTGGGSHTSRGSVTRRRRGPREAGGSSFPWHHLLGGGRSARAAGLRLRRRRGAQTHGQMVVGLKR